MLYRIDFERFLTHAIDHFTSEELLSFQYAIISADINHGGRITNVEKISQLFPPYDNVQSVYKEYKTKDVIRGPYFEHLKEFDKDIHNMFVRSILNHYDIMIMCRRDENDYIDILCEYLSEKFGLECIDLNELFSKGRVGTLYIDRKEIYNKTVKIRRAAAKEELDELASSPQGRMSILKKMMTKADKIRKLNELGIKVTKADHDSLDELLIEEWVEDD